MARFQVHPEQAPGIWRAGVGFFRPGDVLELPDAASQPNDVIPLRLIPLDDEARAMLLDSKARRDAHRREADPAFIDRRPIASVPSNVEEIVDIDAGNTPYLGGARVRGGV